MWYKIHEGIPIACENVQEHTKWAIEQEQKGIDWKRVKLDYVKDNMISTVFLGLDHNYTPGGDPVLFETMIFGGNHNNYQRRYKTIEEAIEGHKVALELVEQDNILE